MITNQLVMEILALASIVVPITQAVKKWFKIDGYYALIASGIISLLLALWRILSEQPYDWSRFIILSLGVFLEANGIYHFGSRAIGKLAKQQK